ncbi:hypothetical protein HHTV1_31 [Haloarcula hispanica tailed virus 1]|uniref:Uncharacterized protein n=1 Tax=Haloarcula hispanica tailed virus 1 TaxID=1273750 RepID=R4TGC3_9CAUD|nr:hypothetical protein M198_gp31 [Haloarcula hispanica tailed virus 1]AGM11286.1 hypothetical protein HHTV1_31 [Haloarcula hispanica tailed virus 1]
MALELKTEGWHAGNAIWNTYLCDQCSEEVHSTERDPEPRFCPYCGTEADLN